VSDIDTAVADSLKVLDLKWPIREADILAYGRIANIMAVTELCRNAAELMSA
jgi:hypothetical protein